MNASSFPAASALLTCSWFSRRRSVMCAMCVPARLPGAAKAQVCRSPHCEGRRLQRNLAFFNQMRELAGLALLAVAALSPDLFP